MKTGIYPGISNADYHADPAISKSQLDLVRRAPGLLEWSRNAPRGVSDAADIGNAAHCMLLEPAEFADRFIVAPKFDRRTNQGKADAAAFEADCAGKTILSDDDWDKLQHMRDSVMAHPDAASLLSLKGLAEHSVWWTDPITGVQCRARPDWWIKDHRIMVDVKTADKAADFHWSVRDYRYDVQQAFYSDGAAHAGAPVDMFLFLVVGKSREMGRYPVRVVELLAADVERGRQEYQHDLATVAECQRTKEWPGIERVSVPERKYY